ncbi:MAG TPA: ABC transporter ATP-binding protein [Mycobacteriales bacterium]
MAEENVVISARAVGKSFRGSARATSLKERVLRMGHGTGERFQALTDVTLDITAGHTVGLIGPNGSGKSTLLKILTGILRPSTGTVDVRGRVSSLLELGAGFNGELSGRDNIYLNASLLGLSRKETDGLFDSIVAFAELEDFIDNPVKHYSSGMYVRLGFAVAVHVDPDILLVDEVLAVGDEAFAKKCLDKIAEFQRDGRTILFVTHSLDLVDQICDRGIVLDHGRVVFDGDPQFATGTLRALLGTAEPTVAPPEDPEPGLVFGDITIGDVPGTTRGDFRAGDPVGVRVELAVSAATAPRIAAVVAVVMGAGDIPVWVMQVEADALPTDRPGTWTVDFAVADCPPLYGAFQVAVRVDDVEGTIMGVTRSRDTFWVRSGQAVGLLAVPYRVRTSSGELEQQAGTSAGRGAG